MTITEEMRCPTCSSRAEPPSSSSSDPYWTCESCELFFQDPMPAKKFEADEEKGEDGRSVGHLLSESDRKATANLARLFATNWIQKVQMHDDRAFYKTLDIGAKYPYFASILKKEFRINAYGLDGMDFDQPTGKPIIHSYEQELGVPMLMLNFETIQPRQLIEHTSDAYNFDAITLIHCFEHMYDPQAALQKIRALIRKQGVVFIRVPSHDCEGFQEHMNDRQYSVHPYFYSERSMRVLIEKVGGFEIVETYGMAHGIRDFILKPKDMT